MEHVIPAHDHNNTYVRSESCRLIREKQELMIADLCREVRSTRKLTWAVLLFQFTTLGGLLLRWAIN